MNALAPTEANQSNVIEAVIARGDLARLTADERTQYYLQVCRSIGLNPMTRPFEYITLNGKLTLYARRDAADQLRKLHNISIEIVSQGIHEGLLTIHVRAKDKTGRVDEDFGVVNIATLKGEVAANAFLKAVTKAKRRVTLSIAGLGFLDETEVDDIPQARAQVALAPAQVCDEPDDGARVRFIESCMATIEAATDAKTLGEWWNSDNQKEARRFVELDQVAVDQLKSLVLAKRAELMGGK